MQTNQITLALEKILENHYNNPQDFEKFISDIATLGVRRITYDALLNVMSFYSLDDFMWSTIRKDIQKGIKQQSWQLGKKLDKKLLEKALHAIDSGKIDAVSFHREIFYAGVVSVALYIEAKVIYYLGIDGDLYIEKI